jgi:hypothetical protein
MNYVTMDVDEAVQFDRERLLQVVHYVCAAAPVSDLGRARLHKILYLADMLDFASTGHPLTGAEYRRQSFGPVARQLPLAVRTLQKDQALKVTRRDHHGFPKYDFISLRQPDTSRLSADELRLIDEVIGYVCTGTAGELSELNPDSAWNGVEIGDRIPYFTAFGLYPVEITDEDIEWGEAEARKVLAGRHRDRR